jgi:beta-lactamase class A
MMSMLIHRVLLFSTFLLGSGFVCAQTASTGPSLEDRVKAIAAAHHGNVALFAENLKTHETVALQPDLPVQTASTIKLAILYEALEQIRAGKVHWDDKITISKDDIVGGSGILLMFDTPHTITFKDALTMMIVMSDNSASNLSMEHVGIQNVDNRMVKLGLKNTWLYKKVMKPVAPGVTLPDDYKKFGLGKTTAREIAELMTKIATCQLGDADAPAKDGDQALCDVALQMLHWQFYRTSIPRYLTSLPGETDDSIANKTGSLNAVRADVAAISTKNGMVVMACYTFDNKDQSWGFEHEGEATIAKIAREVISTWSSDGLSAWPKPAPSAAGSH